MYFDVRRVFFVHIKRVISDREDLAVILERYHILLCRDLPGVLAVYLNGAGPKINAESVMDYRIVKFHALLRKQEVLPR